MGDRTPEVVGEITIPQTGGRRNGGHGTPWHPPRPTQGGKKREGQKDVEEGKGKKKKEKRK